MRVQISYRRLARRGLSFQPCTWSVATTSNTSGKFQGSPARVSENRKVARSVRAAFAGRYAGHREKPQLQSSPLLIHLQRNTLNLLNISHVAPASTNRKNFKICSPYHQVKLRNMACFLRMDEGFQSKLFHHRQPPKHSAQPHHPQKMGRDSYRKTMLSNGTAAAKFTSSFEQQNSRQGCSSAPSRSASAQTAAPCRCCKAQRTSETESRTPRNPRNRASPKVPCTHVHETHAERRNKKRTWRPKRSSVRDTAAS